MKTIIYSHGGSGNHGCEALVRSTIKILDAIGCLKNPILYSYRAEEDRRYGIDKLITDIKEVGKTPRDLEYFFRALFFKMGCKKVLIDYSHRALLNDVQKGDLCIAIGGDCYTYDGWPELLGYLHKRIKKKGGKTVLWGVSLSEELMHDPKVVQDMKSYDLITVREPITFRLLAEAGVKDNVVMVSDPAFELDITPYDVHKLFNNDNPIVGINLSPLIISCENKDNVTVNNYRSLVRHLLKNTKYNVLLVPHVVWDGIDDREAMKRLADEFKSDRLSCLQDMDCTQLKGAIGKCKFFIGARTHSTIAAYSQCVPTLVVGYSVKAKGIAESLFGTTENYVLPVQSLQQETDLKNAFLWLEENEVSIKKILADVMPNYRKHCYDGIEKMRNICEIK